MPSPEQESFLLEVLDEQEFLEIDLKRIRKLCERIVEDAGAKTGRIGIILVDSETIHQYNRDFLQHDYPTDVISFPIEERLEEGHLEGEILACTQVAQDRAVEFGWSPQEEILLYVVHGILHLVGYDDTTPEERKLMRQKEKNYLALINIFVPEWDCEIDSGESTEQKEEHNKSNPDEADLN